MDAPHWITRVAAAQSTGAVLQVVREYVASHDAANLATLPDECRPPPLEGVTDVASYAYTLAKHPRPCDGALLVEEMSVFFARASIRIAELEAPTFTSRPNAGRAGSSA